MVLVVGSLGRWTRCWLSVSWRPITRRMSYTRWKCLVNWMRMASAYYIIWRWFLQVYSLSAIFSSGHYLLTWGGCAFLFLIFIIILLSGGLPADDWQNFKQRFPNPDLKPDQSENDATFIARMEALDDAIEIRMWASYRGQTLARTVRGMMYYERSVPLSFEEVISREGVVGQCVRWYVVKFWSWVYHSAHAQLHDPHLLHCFVLSEFVAFDFPSFHYLVPSGWQQ